MPWDITIHKKASKQIAKIPKREQEMLKALLRELNVQGPILPNWPNYSKLGPDLYHCHLGYKWVACWRLVDQTLRLIELYYVGSRENAPY